MTNRYSQVARRLCSPLELHTVPYFSIVDAWAGQEYRIVGYVVGSLSRTIFDLTCDSSIFPLAPFHVNSPFNYHTNKVLDIAYAAIDVKYSLVTRRDHRWQ
jgi:hypothetical protein